MPFSWTVCFPPDSKNFRRALENEKSYFTCSSSNTAMESTASKSAAISPIMGAVACLMRNRIIVAQRFSTKHVYYIIYNLKSVRLQKLTQFIVNVGSNDYAYRVIGFTTYNALLLYLTIRIPFLFSSSLSSVFSSLSHLWVGFPSPSFECLCGSR